MKLGNTHLKYKFGIPVFIMLTGILFSCVNDLDTIRKVTYDSNAPDEVTQDLNVMYTDSGYARVHIFATHAERSSKPEDITKFKGGIKVKFYSEDGKIVSELTSRYGQINHSTKIIQVRDSVELRNLEKNQLLETEELHWNQTDSSIYSDKNVVVTTPDKVGYGKGIQTNQNFDYYKILKPYGKMEGGKK
ncbi:MAG: LPS export ABC transporter periplasmic protein LptC [Crocinitomicaceae bacterium]|nr:LPS export ABC transporter periplasmic protein LptC [Crocinitomicaceae bacterium]